MHILFLIYSLEGGGAERVTSLLSNRMVELGHSVTIATFVENTVCQYPLDGKVRTLGLDIAGEGDNLLHSLSLLLRRIRGIRTLLKSESPDLAVGMMASAATLLALAAQGLPVRTVGSERVHPPQYPLPRVWEWVRQRTYPMLDAVVAQTSESADWLQLHAPGRRVAVIPNPWCALPETPSIPSPNVLADGTKIILGVGRLVPQKRFHLLVEAFARVCWDRPEWVLVIAGAGPERQHLEQLVQETGIEQKVHLPGNVGNPRDWYRAADVFAMSSAFEGFPNALLEAMAEGLPVVAIDCPTGPAELIDHQVNGLLVEDNSSGALDAALSQMMDDCQFRSRLGNQAKQVRSDYALDRVTNKWLELAEIRRK